MIAIIEDDSSIRELVCYTLKNSGFDAKGFEYGRPFFESLEEGIPQLVLLDIMLPEEDGLSILRRLRMEERTKNIPVIMLTAKDTEFDKVIGLDMGADDYITKPFGMMELVSRVKAVMRRFNVDSGEGILNCGGICVDNDAHRVTVNGRETELTLKEYELLCSLLRSRDKVLTRDALLQQIWGYDFDGETRTVDVHVGSLRSKLGDAGELIETVRGVGYRIRGGAW